MARVGILGAGTWGMALARMLANSGHDVIVWSAVGREIDELEKTHRQPNLPDMEVPESVRYTKNIEEACSQAEIIMFAVPSLYVRPTAAQAAPFISDDQIVVNVGKGIEADTLFSLTEVISEESGKMGRHPAMVALSGPTHAEEVARDIPSTIVSACEDRKAAEFVQQVFMNTCMRVYTNPDVMGVELCGAMKNIIALASGIVAGLGYGDNTRAALLTRGMAEITRLGKAMGCREQTFAGLAGIGDLIVTATSMHSRNNQCGILIGQGYSPEEAVKKVGMVVEGINALPAAMHLSEHYGVEMPICEAVNGVVKEGVDPREAVMELMVRDKKPEFSQTSDRDGEYGIDGDGIYYEGAFLHIEGGMMF